MIEEDAKTQWCPFARTQEYDATGNTVSGVNRNRYGASSAGCLCIASSCMAWRWKLEFEPMGTPPMDGMRYKNSETEGYCGMVTP